MDCVLRSKSCKFLVQVTFTVKKTMLGKTKKAINKTPSIWTLGLNCICNYIERTNFVFRNRYTGMNHDIKPPDKLLG